MPGLRRLLIIVVVLCLLLPLMMVPTEGHLTLWNNTWIVTLPASPFWKQTPPPAYQVFANDFNSSEGFPRAGTPGVHIYTTKRFDLSALYTLIWLWPISLMFGCLYLGFREQRRDALLHCVGFGGIGVTIGCLIFLVLWQGLIIWSLEFTTIAFITGALIGGLFYHPSPVRQNVVE